MPLMRCGGCQHRKYCSRVHQKEHWRSHKMVCSRPKEVIAAIMAGVLDGGPLQDLEDDMRDLNMAPT